MNVCAETEPRIKFICLLIGLPQGKRTPLVIQKLRNGTRPQLLVASRGEEILTNYSIRILNFFINLKKEAAIAVVWPIYMLNLL